MILSAKYELMRKNFRNFAETEFTTEIQEILDKEGGFDSEMYKKMAKCKRGCRCRDCRFFHMKPIDSRRILSH